MTSHISFGSDNHAGAHPDILKKIHEVNLGFYHAYGRDPESEKAYSAFNDLFGPCEVSFVFNGTAANILGLSTAVESFEAVLCSDQSHLYLDSLSSLEKFRGCKLIGLPSEMGKLQIADLAKWMIRRGDQHFSQVKAVSISQPTELGTTYSLEELKRLREFCDRHNLLLHIDLVEQKMDLFLERLSFILSEPIEKRSNISGNRR
jgi:threonine aldolase